MFWALFFVFFPDHIVVPKKKKKNTPHPRQLTYWGYHLPAIGLPAIGFYSFNYKIINAVSGWLLD